MLVLVSRAPLYSLTNQVWIVRPRRSGRALVISVPADTGKRCSVVILIPTAIWPRSWRVSHSLAPIEAAVSARTALTPPWTIPYGCFKRSLTSMVSTTWSALTDWVRIPQFSNRFILTITSLNKGVDLT